MKRSMLLVTGLLLACGGGAEQGGGGAGQPGGAAAAAPLGSAAITGTISFTGTPPQNPTIDMSAEPACKAKHTGQPRDPVVVVTDGKLSGVFVYVTSGLPEGQTYAAPTTKVELDQSGCLYQPRVFGVMANQPIDIKNGDPVLHNIKAVPQANRGFNISQPVQGMESERSFSRPELAIPLECNVHSWMHGHVFVMDHPYFATTGTDGTFTIKGLPAGTYTIEAWHEKLGSKTTTVTVAENGTATTAIVFGTGMNGEG